jgi:DNA-binding response OmpR family regulator
MKQKTSVGGKAKRARSRRVLLIEDEPALRELYRAWLTMDGYEVAEAVDGVEGMEMILHGRPSLVILDIMLPKKDGFEVLAEVRRNPKTRDLPVLVLTSLDQAYEKQHGGRLGANRYMVKTDLSPDRLLTAARELLS